MLQNKKIGKVAQNAAFEWIYFWRYGIYPWPLAIDTMLLHHCLYPDFGGTEDVFGRKRDLDNPGHGLAFINSQYTWTPYYKDDGRRWVPALGDEAFWRYNCNDVMCTMDIAMKMKQEAIEDGLWDVYLEHYNGAFPHAIRMEWDGVAIDIAKRDDARRHAVERVKEIKSNIHSVLGYELNVASPKQMAEFLYKTKKFQVRKNKKTGKPTVDKYALQAISAKTNDPLIDSIIELRRLQDEISDIYDQELGEDGHMHTHYKLGGTDGARWSSGESILGNGTNLQNLPRKGVARSLYLPG